MWHDIGKPHKTVPNKLLLQIIILAQTSYIFIMFPTTSVLELSSTRYHVLDTMRKIASSLQLVPPLPVLYRASSNYDIVS